MTALGIVLGLIMVYVCLRLLIEFPQKVEFHKKQRAARKSANNMAAREHEITALRQEVLQLRKLVGSLIWGQADVSIAKTRPMHMDWSKIFPHPEAIRSKEWYLAGSAPVVHGKSLIKASSSVNAFEQNDEDAYEIAAAAN